MDCPMSLRSLLAAVWFCGATSLLAADAWIELPGGPGLGHGKSIVFVSGDEEYRSEEALPQLAKILSKHHGFACTVLFPIDPATGEINPEKRDNIPGLEALKTADLMVIATRFRELPDEQMQHIADYIESGRPVVGLRTATHAFNNAKSPRFAKYHWQSNVAGYEQGFGRQVLGETWISHHGQHGKQSTRGIPAPGQEQHPILRGIQPNTIWGPTDVYGVRLPLPGDSQPIVLGQILVGMKPDDAPLEGAKNDPMMPVAWTKTYTGAAGKPARVFTTTMGSSTDLTTEGTRRLIVNGCLWALGLDIPAVTKVDIVGPFEPLPFKFGGHKRGVKPADLQAN
jgi:type 1 glutamine amidotransferase